MKSTMTYSTPVTGLSCFVATERSAHTSPVVVEQGTGLSFAGSSLAQVAFRARVTDLPGLPPRGAPV